MTTYDSSAVVIKLEKFSGWKYSNKAIEKLYSFENFREVIGFMVRVSFICESMNHHPDWTNVYNKLTIRLSTHDAGGVTDKDFKLAEEIDKIYK